jgi:hypothetical protein
VSHFLAKFAHGAADMRREDHVGKPEQLGLDVRLVLVDVEPGAGNAP